MAFLGVTLGLLARGPRTRGCSKGWPVPPPPSWTPNWASALLRTILPAGLMGLMLGLFSAILSTATAA